MMMFPGQNLIMRRIVACLPLFRLSKDTCPVVVSMNFPFLVQENVTLLSISEFASHDKPRTVPFLLRDGAWRGLWKWLVNVFATLHYKTNDTYMKVVDSPGWIVIWSWICLRSSNITGLTKSLIMFSWVTSGRGRGGGAVLFSRQQTIKGNLLTCSSELWGS